MVIEQDFMHARAIAERQRHQVLQAGTHVVGVEHRVLGGLAHAVGAVRQHVAHRADEHAHLPVERAHAAERLACAILRMFDQPHTIRIGDEVRQRRKRCERGRQRHRPGARTAAAVRRRERLVQVDVHGVDAEIARPHLADNGVEVHAVGIEQRAGRVHRLGDRDDVALEQPAGVGIGDHHRRDVGAKPCLQGVNVDTAGGGGRDVLHAVAGEGGRGGIGAMRARRHKHDFALVAASLERGADAQEAAQFAMRAGLGAHRHAVHPGEVEQPERQLIDHLERALDGLLRLERVDVGEARQPSDLFVQTRVMLHRARAEREQAEVDRVILPRQARVVADGLRFAEAGKADRTRAFEPAEPRFPLREVDKIDARLLGVADLEDQRLLEHQCPVAGDGIAWALLVGWSGGPPAGGIDGHAHTSCSAASSAAISSSVVVSVTAMTRPFLSPSAPG